MLAHRSVAIARNPPGGLQEMNILCRYFVLYAISPQGDHTRIQLDVIEKFYCMSYKRLIRDSGRVQSGTNIIPFNQPAIIEFKGLGHTDDIVWTQLYIIA